MSNVNLEANLTKDPVLAFTKDNTPVANLSVAENRRYQQEGEWKSEVAYYDCSVFGPMAQYVVDSLHKGDMVVITGRMQFREWKDDAGTRRTKLEVRVFSIGASLKFARVEIRKVAREDSNAAAPEAETEAAPLAATGTDDII